ncbi:hypothetical protein NL321_29540, partial [Klebsiella pneumoniae]|nr:hypothetical protein [Klebsiella pneumoniae]
DCYVIPARYWPSDTYGDGVEQPSGAQDISPDSRLYEDLLAANQPARAEPHPADDGDEQDLAYARYVARTL